MRPDHGNGEGVHRSSRHRRRALRESPRRARSRCGEPSTNTTSRSAWRIPSLRRTRARSSRWRTSSTRCAAASPSAWFPAARRIPSRCAAPRRGSSRFWSKAELDYLLDQLATGELREFFTERDPALLPRSPRLQVRRSQRGAQGGRLHAEGRRGPPEQLAEVRPTPDFEPLAASFKRINNILKQAEFRGHASAKSTPGCWKRGRRKSFTKPTAGARVRVPRKALRNCGPTVDRFFDKVMVNVAG